MAVAWLLFTLLTFYTCVRPQCCEEAVVDPITAPIEETVDDNFAVYTTTGAAAVSAGSLWPETRDRLAAEYAQNPDRMLDVYGRYYASEPAPAGFENMGLARAADIRDLIVAETDIPADRINLLARRLDGDAPADGDRWDAANFNYSELRDADAGDDRAEVVELDEDEILIRFPFNASTKNLEANVTDYLDRLAERIQQTNERVTITGHTDNIDTDEFNMRLGQRRADFVRDILVRNGASANLITTRSEGESSPTASNATAAGRAQNRRAVVRLQRAQ